MTTASTVEDFWNVKWAGTGVIWTVAGGVLTSKTFSQNMKPSKGQLHFVQISDSHMGFNKPANPDVGGTLQATITKINSLPEQREFIIHTGDITHSAKAEEFDTFGQLIKGAKPKQTFFVPGEHDTATDDGKLYLQRYGKNTKGQGCYSFNHKDVHFVGLSNVAILEGMGTLGAEQLQWLEADLKTQPASRPVVVFAHIPLWSVYLEWG
jgi:Icc protein